MINELNPLSFFATLCIIQHVQTNLYQTSFLKDKEKFYFFKSRSPLKEFVPFKQENHKDFNSCLRSCKLEGNACASITIVKNSDSQNFSCNFFDRGNIDLVKDSTNLLSYFVNKSRGYCSEYCQWQNGEKLCGGCKCRNTCGLQKNYQCNCTQLIPTMRSCEKIFQSGNILSGWYLIDPDGKGAFQVMCHTQKMENTNRDINCSFKQNTWSVSNNSKDSTLKDSILTFSDCMQYCYSFLAFQNYNGWSYNPSYKLCTCIMNAVTTYVAQNWYSCIVTLTPVLTQRTPFPTTVMFRRQAGTDPSFWNKSLDMYYEGFHSADNLWIGLYQLERISAVFRFDIKVLIATRSMKDIVTTYYRDVRIKRTLGTFTINFNAFDSNNARSLGYFDKSQLVDNTTFKSCKWYGTWWTSCSSINELPTKPTADFGFGTITDITSITFFLLTKS